MNNENNRIEQYEKAFKRRYDLKKSLNILISVVIAILGISSFVYIWVYDGDGILTFRWMTVDGTLFTATFAMAYVVVSLVEIVADKELTSRVIYFARLSCSVAESLIMIVVLLSQLPFSPDHMHIFRFDMFNMHILIPVRLHRF